MQVTKDYTWLVGSRSKVQLLLFELYNFLKVNRFALQQKEAERSVFGLLVGEK